jgi:hypothetical protein
MTAAEGLKRHGHYLERRKSLHDTWFHRYAPPLACPRRHTESSLQRHPTHSWATGTVNSARPIEIVRGLMTTTPTSPRLSPVHYLSFHKPDSPLDPGQNLTKRRRLAVRRHAPDSDPLLSRRGASWRAGPCCPSLARDCRFGASLLRAAQPAAGCCGPSVRVATRCARLESRTQPPACPSHHQTTPAKERPPAHQNRTRTFWRRWGSNPGRQLGTDCARARAANSVQHAAK